MISIEAFLFGLATALIGYLVGNRFTIDRDKQKKWNDLIDPIRADLLSIRIRPENSLAGKWMITFALIREKLPFWQRRGFDRAIEAYKQSKSEYSHNRKPDGMGGFIDGDNTAEDRLAISHAADKLLKYLRPK